ncbi:MAG TPA: SIR2 family protein [Anaeromyxobacter sp.]|nr:SIR2 family protein [Anaeromyxobacter sp.]
MRANGLDAVLDHLLASLQRGQLLLLVGAGASRWAGLPSWREAVCALAEDLVPALRTRFPDARERFGVPGPGDRVPVEALLRIPEAHRRLCGEARLVERLSELFDTSSIDPASLPLQRALVRLSRFVPAIYTTNFDDLLERTFEWEGRSCQVVAGPEDLKAWRFEDRDGAPVPRFPIYKLHGTLGRPGSLVVSESDFLRRSDLAANPIDLRFCSDVMGRELLLVGYGFNDPNMRWIWAKLRDLEVPPVGWFLELGASSDLERATTELDGIVRVDLEAEDTDRPRELLAFLGALADRREREQDRGSASPARG